MVVLEFSNTELEELSEAHSEWSNNDLDFRNFVKHCALEYVRDMKIVSNWLNKHDGEKEEQEETQNSKDQRSSPQELHCTERPIHSNTHSCEAERTGTGDCSRQGYSR